MESLLINNTICLLALVLLSGCGGPSEEKHVTNEQREQPHRNRLAAEKSLYLRQHAGNPVDWYPWGDEAFARAKKEEKPIFLSIGYSSCHWCHVMERESFENPAIAALLNKDYVCIKVDREERPDIDNVYMTAVQLMTHHGGWPLTVFLTPDLKPFAGGTYFPPDHLKEILARVVEVWKKEKEMIVRESGTITEAVRSVLAEQGGERFDVSGEWFERALETYKSRYDATNGGFGRSPKFPPAMDLMLMLRVHRRGSVDDVLPMVEKTLERMACGGMFDHLGGGFHRYSTDERWLVPHFEKMLYDQAMISRAYLEAYQATGKPFYADVARATFDYVLRDMTSPKGGFYASEDADSEGEEGRFYVWTRKEIAEVLTAEESKAFIDRFGVTERGNFEADANILATATVAGEACNVAKRKLLERRSRRPRPARDEKILTAWNGLTISSLAIGSRVLDDDRYLRAAAGAARYLLATHVDAKGRLLRMSVDGVAKVEGFLEDYAHFTAALIDLYEADGDPAWLRSATRLVDDALRLFPRGDGKGFPQVGNDVRATLVNPIDMGDGVVPSGTSTLIWSMIRLSTLTGKDNLRKEAEQAVRAASADLERNGVAFAMLMCAVDATIGPSVEIVVVGAKDDPRTREMVRAAWRRFIPSRSFAVYDGTHSAEALSAVRILEGRMTIGDAPVAYVCVGNVCGEPCRDLASFDRQLSEASHR